MAAKEENPSDPYVLNRNVAATARLNLQHYIWKEEMGYLLHPSIPNDRENLRVADVGTGTGIWLLDIAHNLPASAQLEGLDISLDQTPPTSWLPPNVSFHHFNIFHEIPEDLVEQYDIVHVRLLILVVQNNSPVPVLRQLLKLLSIGSSLFGVPKKNQSFTEFWSWPAEPGGYLQWGEIDLPNRRLVKTDSQNSSQSLEELRDGVSALLRSPYSSWPADLAEKYEMQGMMNVIADKRWMRLEYLSFVHANHLLIQDEIINRVAGEKMAQLQEVYADAVVESRKGAAWNVMHMYTVGQKAVKKAQ
ncbi:hypothetical protein MMC12_002278 [Toensbergia leucococca]|nr:hypothetical protein [Toensbergia leucococca]